MVNYNGTAITYDEIGNPQNWRDGMSFSWTGRQLDSVTKNGVITTYTYDSNGLRTSKTTGDDVTEYTYLGSSLVYQVTNKGQSDEESLYFYYDDTGLAAFYYESAQYPSDNGIYHYVKDAQGNIWGIIDNKGTQIVKYEFSAYGEYRSRWNPEEVSSGEISRNIRIRNANPFDYRGYYYDEETGLYYCQSRYYDPEVDRWLNADIKIGAGYYFRGYNLFAYCLNDPVGLIDPKGQRSYDITTSYVLFKNYKYNKSHDIVNEFIYGQEVGPVADLKYGIAKMGDVGCEIISVYNAMLLLGMEASLADVIFTFENSSAIWVWGTMGSKPHKIGSILDSYNMSYTKYDTLDELYNNISMGSVFIMSFWKETFKNGMVNIIKGLHTVAIFKSWGNREQYMIYNAYDNSNDVVRWSSLESYIGNGKFITSYVLNNIWGGGGLKL